jgi:transposase-like protein
MRCPKCGSLHTVKNGSRQIEAISVDGHSLRKVARHLCKECGYSFSNRLEKKKKYSSHLKREAARMHVEERMSYRVIAKRLTERTGKRFWASSVCRMVNEVASKSKGSIAMQREYRPDWEGYLTVDDKWLRIKGKAFMALIAVDSTGDIVHRELLPLHQQEGVDDFFYFIKEQLNYPIKAITTDLDILLRKAVLRVYGGSLPHQKCVKHAIEAIKRDIGYSALKRELKQREKGVLTGGTAVGIDKLVEFQKQQEEFLCKVRKFLYCSTKAEAAQQYRRLLECYYKLFPQSFSFLKKHKELLLTHINDKNIPKTNNIAENINRQIMRRVKTIESFQSIDTAFNYLGLFVNYLRCKPYTDCRGKRKYRNGKSPLQLCNVNLNSSNWLDVATFFY